MSRSKFEGVMRVVQFNWPMYVAAAAAVILLVMLAQVTAIPVWARVGLLLAAAAAGWQAMASLGASYWVYDLSPLHHWRWLREHSGPAGRIVNVHSGYDETSDALIAAFPESQLAVIDFYDSLARTEPSIEKARRLFPGRHEPISRALSGWPLEASSVDLLVLAFAAHEIRDAAGRETIFREAARVVSPGGRIVLVEHLRDLPNFLAFGPGVLHFLCEREWLRCSQVAGLKVLERFRITPFIGVYVLCR